MKLGKDRLCIKFLKNILNYNNENMHFYFDIFIIIITPTTQKIHINRFKYDDIQKCIVTVK